MIFLRKIYPYFTFLMVFLFSLKGVYGDDIWFHLATGRYVFSERTIPVLDIFSFTAEGKTWVNQNWLSDTIFYLIERGLGEIGLGLFMALTITASMFLVYKAGMNIVKRKEILLAGVFLVSYFAISRFQARPETGSYFFLALIFYLLTRGSLKWGKMLIPIIILLWANWQTGFVPFGLFVLGVYAFHRFISKFQNGKIMSAIAAIRTEILILFVSIAFSVINPLGISGVLYFISVRPGYLVADFTEWGSIVRILSLSGGIFSDLDFGFLLLGYVLFVLIIIFTIYLVIKEGLPKIKVFAEKKNSWVLLLFPLLFLPFFAYRFIPLSIIAMYLISAYIVSFTSFSKRMGERVLAVLSLLVIASSLIRFKVFKPVLATFDNKTAYREEAINFLRGSGLKGNMYNPLEDGGYFIWKMPERKVFIDERLDVYTASGVYDEYKKIYSFPPEENWKEVVDKYDIEIILLPGWQDEPLKTILDSNEFKLIYWSDYFFIIARTDGENKKYVEENKIEVLEPFKKEEYEGGNLTKAINDALKLGEKSPISANILVTLGNLYYQDNQLEPAIEALEESFLINDKDNQAKLFLGSLYVEDEQCDLALAQFGSVEGRGNTASEAIAYSNMGNVYLDCLGDLNSAYKYFAKFVNVGRKLGVDESLLEEVLYKMEYIKQAI